MARIVNLDEYVPEDIEFHYRDQVYTLPGDLDVDATFVLLKLFEEGAAITEAAASAAKKNAYNQKVVKELLTLFQLRQPEMQKLPFGQLALSHILVEVLILLGLAVGATDPTPPTSPATTGNRASRRAAAKKSPRTSGSPGSSTRSGSPPAK